MPLSSWMIRRALLADCTLDRRRLDGCTLIKIRHRGAGTVQTPTRDIIVKIQIEFGQVETVILGNLVASGVCNRTRAEHAVGRTIKGFTVVLCIVNFMDCRRSMLRVEGNIRLCISRLSTNTMPIKNCRVRRKAWSNHRVMKLPASPLRCCVIDLICHLHK